MLNGDSFKQIGLELVEAWDEFVQQDYPVLGALAYILLITVVTLTLL